MKNVPMAISLYLKNKLERLNNNTTIVILVLQKTIVLKKLDLGNAMKAAITMYVQIVMGYLKRT